jgi:type IX secretion system PorP/SprF family membrane protein
MKKFIIILSLFFSVVSNAQSYHFSQFYATPLLMNPAFTGYTDGPYRVASNYRSQWSGANEPYTTSSLSIDFSPLRKKLADGNRLGFGLSVLNDKTMGGAVQNNFIGFSTAYNLSLDADQVHHIGLGFQGIYRERRVDFSRLSFENQLSSGGFDLSLPTGESIPAGKKGYFDLSAGSLYNYTADDKSFFAGVSVYNILKQKETYLSEEFTMPKRISLLAGGRLDVGYSGILHLSLNYQTQGKVNETTIGAAYGLQLGSEKKQVVSFGAWHRINDAIIPYVGYQLNGFQAGFSYDYTISNLKTAGQVKSGFEISLVYTAEDKSELKRLIPWY